MNSWDPGSCYRGCNKRLGIYTDVLSPPEPHLYGAHFTIGALIVHLGARAMLRDCCVRLGR